MIILIVRYLRNYSDENVEYLNLKIDSLGPPIQELNRYIEGIIIHPKI